MLSILVTYTDVTNNYAATPLHWACWNGHKDIVQWLVKVGKCDVGELFL